MERHAKRKGTARVFYKGTDWGAVASCHWSTTLPTELFFTITQGKIDRVWSLSTEEAWKILSTRVIVPDATSIVGATTGGWSSIVLPGNHSMHIILPSEVIIQVMVEAFAEQLDEYETWSVGWAEEEEEEEES